MNVAELPEEIDISTYSEYLAPLRAGAELQEQRPSILTASFLSLQLSRAGNHMCSQGTIYGHHLSQLLLQNLFLGVSFYCSKALVM